MYLNVAIIVYDRDGPDGAGRNVLVGALPQHAVAHLDKGQGDRAGGRARSPSHITRPPTWKCPPVRRDIARKWGGGAMRVPGHLKALPRTEGHTAGPPPGLASTAAHDHEETRV